MDEEIIEKFWRGVQTGKGEELKILWSYDLVGSTPTRATKYVYLLGMYLGDGYINKQGKNCYRLRISLNEKQDIVESLVRESLSACFPNNIVGCALKQGCKDVGVYSNNLVHYFPQHGEGFKHDRLIKLEPWQEELVKEFPQAFIMGLLHSDGCYFINKVGKYEYPSYQFTNKSKCIIDLFSKTLDMLDIKYRIVKKKKEVAFNCVITRRSEVNKIKEFWIDKQTNL